MKKIIGIVALAVTAGALVVNHFGGTDMMRERYQMLRAQRAANLHNNKGADAPKS